MKKKRQWFMCLGMIGVFTASVILSVFGQRKVKAQLNTENAGRSQAVGEMTNIFFHHLMIRKH